VVDSRKQLGPDAKLYIDSLQLLVQYKRLRFVAHSSSRRISRLWRKLRDQGRGAASKAAANVDLAGAGGTSAHSKPETEPESGVRKAHSH
jgi:hypothetical protein